jgi:hypothetical protein
MHNGEQSGPDDWSDWRVRLATGVGIVAGAAVALLWRPDFFAGEFWLGLLGFCVFMLVGAVLGGLVGGLLFRASSGRPPGPAPPA